MSCARRTVMRLRDCSSPWRMVIGPPAEPPPVIARVVARRYAHVAEHHEFPNQGHWMLGQPGWTDVAGMVHLHLMQCEALCGSEAMKNGFPGVRCGVRKIWPCKIGRRGAVFNGIIEQPFHDPHYHAVAGVSIIEARRFCPVRQTFAYIIHPRVGLKFTVFYAVCAIKIILRV